MPAKETDVPKYMVQVTYAGEGSKGVLKDGGTSRRAAAMKLAESLGGTVEAFYFTLGQTGALVIVDMPDNASVAAIALTIGASGAGKVKTTALLTPEDIDMAAKKTPSYRPPGS